MAKKLQRVVHVGGTVYGPGDDVPADVLAKITNPKAFEPEGGGQVDGDEGAAAAPPAPAPAGGRRAAAKE